MRRTRNMKEPQTRCAPPPSLATALSYFRDVVVSGRAERELLDFEGLVVGTACNFVPDELIWAVGGRPIRLCGGSAQGAEEGEKLLSRQVCSVATSTAGLPTLQPELWERLDLLIIPAACDAKKKLAEVFSKQKSVHVMDVPASKDSAPAQGYWLGEVQRLVERIERTAGRKITRVDLDRALRLSMRREALFRELLELRYRPANDGVLLTGEQFQFVAGASFADDPERYTERLDALVGALKEADAAGYRAGRADAPRVVLAGAPLIYPNFKLLDIIHQVGAVVVADSSCSATQCFYQHLGPRDWSMKEMIKALAEKSLLPCMCPCFDGPEDRLDRLRELVRASGAEGVIFHQLRTCPLFAAESELLRRELEPHALPFLVVNTDYAAGDIEYLRTRIEAFLEGLRRREKTVHQHERTT